MNETFFYPADILLPKQNPERFSVVACDQYTSQPAYWESVQELTRDACSAYHLVFPEIDLEKDGFDARIQSINAQMERYLQEDCFRCVPHSMIYVERTLRSGAVRRGVIGAIDLEQYDYQKGSKNYIRATEGTVLERIPPRVRIREHALLELPHVMLLVDDPKKELIEPLADKTGVLECLYDFDLMMDSGSIRGFRLDEDDIARITQLLENYSSADYFAAAYGVSDKPMLFAVGDGNHSLATAKACYEKLKETLSAEEASRHPARYALVELVNLHDASLEFEAIHRVLFGVRPADFLSALRECFTLSEEPAPGAQEFTLVENGAKRTFYLLNPDRNLAVGTIQQFLDGFLPSCGGKIDYIHGEDVVCELCREKTNTGIILPCMDKSDLFQTVILDGALPRKTFSMGEACDKRFYLEARKIR